MTAYTLESARSTTAWRTASSCRATTLRAALSTSIRTFVLPAGTTVWFHDLDGHYEAAYEQKEIADVKAGQWAGPPLTFQLPNGAGYGSITEANLVNYAGMALEADGRRGWIVGLGHRQPLNYPYELRYGREEGKRLGKPAAITGTITTPWRVVIAGRDLNTLVNSDILPNLCPPADEALFPSGMNTDWVAPGLAVWDYVDRNYAPRSEPGRPRPRSGESRSNDRDRFEHMKNFSRMGGQIGAKYHILEGFAYGWSDDEIREFVDYSTEQGVRTLFWRHSRQLRTPEEREEFFSRLQRLGVAGAKIDFIDHEAKEGVDLYEDLLADAARHQLVIDFHGANKPTGRLRTWPNDMLREAVRGMESSSLQERARHEAILPFTRYLAGPCDYTTMIFTERRRDSSWAHQIACLATFHSPMLTIAAHPQSVLDNPAVDVIKSIPAVWDETIVLPDSRIGELSIFARRKGDMWMLAVMCGSRRPHDHGATVVPGRRRIQSLPCARRHAKRRGRETRGRHRQSRRLALDRNAQRRRLRGPIHEAVTLGLRAMSSPLPIGTTTDRHPAVARTWAMKYSISPACDTALSTTSNPPGASTRCIDGHQAE